MVAAVAGAEVLVVLEVLVTDATVLQFESKEFCDVLLCTEPLPPPPMLSVELPRVTELVVLRSLVY